MYKFHTGFSNTGGTEIITLDAGQQRSSASPQQASRHASAKEDKSMHKEYVTHCQLFCVDQEAHCLLLLPLISVPSLPPKKGSRHCFMPCTVVYSGTKWT